MKKRSSKLQFDNNIIDALKSLPAEIEDKRHSIIICFKDDKSRSNETRFEHIAKKYHELKVRDIKAIPNGIRQYVKYVKSQKHKETSYYYIKRPSDDRGFIQIAIKLFKNNKQKAYVKTIYITHRIQKK